MVFRERCGQVLKLGKDQIVKRKVKRRVKKTVKENRGTA
jgi:hypothetical protein